MIFNSIDFAVFLIVVFAFYWFVFKKTARLQNIWLLFSSMFFYGWADYRFLGLLLISILVNYFLGIKITDTKKEINKKRFLWLGLIFNIGILGFFKYFNFFYESFVNFVNLFNGDMEFSPLKILLPLGVSFFTFQMLGYIIDVYKEEIEPSRDILGFSVYVSYFPKLLAGPIERAQKFLPQIKERRSFNPALATDGLRQILWGLFVKMVISNNCAVYANYIFSDYSEVNGSTLLLGTIFYSFEIYGDFSGYSNIAIGVSKLFGINLMTNFATPFFSTNVSDFWKKWHISLTSWMMDYVNTPLSFSLRKLKKAGLLISIVCTFLLVGFWHGADWKYIFYGFLYGLYFIPLLFFKTSNRTSIVAKGQLLPSLKEVVQMVGLFMLVSLTSVFFRADSINDAFGYLSGIFTPDLFSVPQFQSRGMALVIMAFVVLFVIIEWITREKNHPFVDWETKHGVIFRWAVYYTIVLLIFVFAGQEQQFIYFQF